jgi:hypothetical protein
MTMNVIQHQELASAQATITFNSIPQTATDLLLVLSLRGHKYAAISPNSNNANTNMRTIWGTGSNGISGNYASGSAYNIFATVAKDNSTASTFGNATIYIPNYTSSTAKTIFIESVGENNATASEQISGAALWNNTAAITSVVVVAVDDNLNAGGTFAQFSSATLYGITRGSDGIVTVS